MSEQGVTALLERLESDQSFRERLEAAPTNEARKQMIHDAGFDVERSDLPTVRSIIGVHELTDDDLEKVAGGGAVTVATAAVGGATVSAAASAAVLALAGVVVWVA